MLSPTVQNSTRAMRLLASVLRTSQISPSR